MSPPAQNLKLPDFQSLPKTWRQQWWFFDPRHCSGAVGAAFKWELVRRCESYRQIWLKIGRLTISHELVTAAKLGGPFAPEVWGLLASAQSSPVAALAVFHQCSPFDRWLDLNAAQRRTIESSISILPELDSDSAVKEAIGAPGLFEIRDSISENRKYFTSLWAAGGSFMGIRESLAYKRIPPGKWLAIPFNAQLPYDTLAKGFDDVMLGPFGLALHDKCREGCFPKISRVIETLIKELQEANAVRRQAIWEDLADNLAPNGLHPLAWQAECKDLTPDQFRDFRSLVRVAPLRFDPDAACVLPAACNVALARRFFLAAVHRGNRKNWLAECQKHWTIQIASHGHGPLQEQKRVKPLGGKYRWIGLAAHMLNSISMGTSTTRFLCDTWISNTERPHFNDLPFSERRRRAYREIHDLRNQFSHLLNRVG